MSEIEKLMQNANVEKEWKPLPYGDIEEDYPEFTAEKQIELIKWLSHWGIQIGSNKEKTLFEVRVAMKYIISSDNDFTNCLANIIIQLWKDLTETEKAEIKRILE